MGGGNGQKSKMARERNMEKQRAAKGILYISCTSYNFSKVWFFSWKFTDLSGVVFIFY
jgi:hypothetical protein